MFLIDNDDYCYYSLDRVLFAVQFHLDSHYITYGYSAADADLPPTILVFMVAIDRPHFRLDWLS